MVDAFSSFSENVGKKIFTDKQKNKQGKIYTFGGYKQRNKVYLKTKLKPDTNGCDAFSS